jgi:ubiquitin-protein ligase
MPDNRRARLAQDYREMLKLQARPYLSWIATKGELPYAEEYLLYVRLRTYALSVREDSYVVGTIDRCTIRVTLWDSYPYVAPSITMLNLPPVFHPDWYSKGTYCPREPWRPDCPLKDHVLRMLRTLQYEPSEADTDSPANYKALDWYRKNRDNTAWFPSDSTPLTENTSQQIAALEKTAYGVGEIVDSWAIR